MKVCVCVCVCQGMSEGVSVVGYVLCMLVLVGHDCPAEGGAWP